MSIDESIGEPAVGALDHELLVRLISGADVWSTVAVPEIGLSKVVMSDGPAGVRGTVWDERATAVSFPCGVALGATFDHDLAVRLGRALGAQSRARGVHMLLGPTINLQTFARAGRHFEYLSEDAFLTAVLAHGYVIGLQSTGVAATPKHLVANDSETQRHTLDVLVDEAMLREWYLLPFEAALVDAGAWSVMAAYNLVNGVPMTQHGHVLDGILRDDWQWDGVVVTDWGALGDGVAGGVVGLDLAMPGPSTPFARDLPAALQDGRVTQEDLRRKVSRLVRLAGRVGRLGGEATLAPAAGIEDEATAAAVAHEVAAASVVVLANSGALPLRPAAGMRVAVVGPGATSMTTQGGGSAHVNGAVPPSFASALASALGGSVEVVAAEGVKVRSLVAPLGAEVASSDPDTGLPGIGVDYVDASGRVLHHETRAHGRLVWYGDLPFPASTGVPHTVRVRALVTVGEAGLHEVGLASIGSQVLRVDGELAMDADRPPEDRSADTFHSPDERRIRLELDPARPVLLEVEQGFNDARDLSICFLGVQSLVRSADDLVAEAVAAASEADVTVVVVSTNAEFESEGFDRQTLELPCDQDRLVSSVAAVSPRTVVVLNVGAPVSMPWLSQVDAVVAAWFGGQEGPQALARVITGELSPRGRLPFYWPVSPDDPRLLSSAPTLGSLDYRHLSAADTSSRTGWGFPFGHGLSYGSTTWSSISLHDRRPAQPPQQAGGIVAADPVVAVSLTISHAEGAAVDDVVQIFARRESASGPTRRLVGLARVSVEPGAAVAVDVQVPARLLCRWEPASSGWVWDESVVGLEVSRDADSPEATLLLASAS